MIRVNCPRCGKPYDITPCTNGLPRHSDKCPHRYTTLQAKIDAGQK